MAWYDDWPEPDRSDRPKWWPVCVLALGFVALLAVAMLAA